MTCAKHRKPFMGLKIKVLSLPYKEEVVVEDEEECCPGDPPSFPTNWVLLLRICQGEKWASSATKSFLLFSPLFCNLLWPLLASSLLTPVPFCFRPCLFTSQTMPRLWAHSICLMPSDSRLLQWLLASAQQPRHSSLCLSLHPSLCRG